MFLYKKTEKSDNSGLTYFMTNREGGVSSGKYASLNLGLYSGDDKENVFENRKRLLESLGVEEMLIPKEVHGNRVICVNDGLLSKLKCCTLEERELLLEGDALVTNKHEIALCVTTADCVPILLYDQKCSVVASVHAGWRGIEKEILLNTIQTMEYIYGVTPRELRAVVNPCISAEYFETDEDVAQKFIDKFGKESNVVRLPLKKDEKDEEKNEELGKIEKIEKPHIDLIEAVGLQLTLTGMIPKNISIVKGCTYSSMQFYSARRDGFQSGRMVSGIYKR